MTRAEAKSEARKRWGDLGVVWTKRPWRRWTTGEGDTYGGRVQECCVGKINNQSGYDTLGRADSWEAAFADADARATAERGGADGR